MKLMKRHPVCLAFALVMAVLGLALPTSAQGRGWALVVGVDQYESSRIAPLRYASADARVVAQVLRDSCGLPAEHVLLMTTDGPAAERPTSTNVLSRLAGLRGVVRPDDAFLFYFSGHGVLEDGESFLLTPDASPVSVALMRRSALSAHELREALLDLRASRVLLLIDACRNDPQAGRGSGDNPLTEGMSRDLVLVPRTAARPPDVVATLFACRVGQRSYEGYHGHGYFTYFLVNGLRGAAGVPDGTITLPSLLGYLERTVADAVRVHEPGCVQEPWADISGSGASGWVLAHTGALPPPAATAPTGVTRVAVQLRARGSPLTDVLVRQTCAVLQRRLPGARLHTAAAASHRLLIDLPREVDISVAVRRIQTVGLLEFRERLSDGGATGDQWVRAMDGRCVAYADVGLDVGQQPVVNIRFTEQGRLRLGALTKRLIGRPLGIFFDGALVSAPIIREVIQGGRASITAVSRQDPIKAARDLADLLTSGVLPLDVEVLSVQRGAAQVPR